MEKIINDILKLSISERILLVENIWDSIAEKDKPPIILSAETKRLLDNRLDKHKQYPNEGTSWEEVKGRIKKQLQCSD